MLVDVFMIMELQPALLMGEVTNVILDLPEIMSTPYRGWRVPGERTVETGGANHMK